ncbi:MAG: hypothetical protein ACREGA_04705 [Candidatus Saccharimonadales bacterium]
MRQDASTGKIIDNQTAGHPSDELAPGTMHLKVYSPYQTYFDDISSSLSATNATGPFDILAGHHNFMSLLSAGEVVIRRPNDTDLKLKIARGVMHVKANQAIVFLDV